MNSTAGGDPQRPGDDEADGIGVETTWAVPKDDLLAVLALPLDEQPLAAVKGAGPGHLGLPPAEWRTWRSIYDVLRLPEHEQPHAAMRTLSQWAYGWWHKQFEAGRRPAEASRADGKQVGDLAERVGEVEVAVATILEKGGQP